MSRIRKATVIGLLVATIVFAMCLFVSEWIKSWNVAQFVQMLESGSDDERLRAILKLTTLGGPVAISALGRVLHSEIEGHRVITARSLGALGEESMLVVSDLRQALQDPSWAVRHHVAMALTEVAGELYLSEAESVCRQSLVEAKNEAQRASAAFCLGKFHSELAAEALLFSLDDDSAAVRANSIYAFGNRGDGKFAPRIIPFLGDRDTTVRLAAVSTLGRLRTPEALAALQSMHSDSEEIVRNAVTRILSTSPLLRQSRKAWEAIQRSGIPTILTIIGRIIIAIAIWLTLGFVLLRRARKHVPWFDFFAMNFFLFFWLLPILYFGLARQFFPILSTLEKQHAIGELFSYTLSTWFSYYAEVSSDGGESWEPVPDKWLSGLKAFGELTRFQRYMRELDRDDMDTFALREELCWWIAKNYQPGINAVRLSAVYYAPNPEELPTEVFTTQPLIDVPTEKIHRLHTCMLDRVAHPESGATSR